MAENHSNLYQYLAEKLGITGDYTVRSHFGIRVGRNEITVDLAMETVDLLVLLEIKSRINEDTVYRMSAISSLVVETLSGKKELRKVCVGKSINASVEDLSKKLGVETLLIPTSIFQSFKPLSRMVEGGSEVDTLKFTSSRITSLKAWRLICTIIEERPSSILSAAKLAKISYGWTNNIIHKLEQSELIRYELGYRIDDLDRLFNLVSWERPLEGLRIETVNTGFKTANECIEDIALNLNIKEIDYAFTGHSAALYRDTSIIREDTVYIYLRDTRNRGYLQNYKKGTNHGCRINVYASDRDIMSDSQSINGVRIVSLCTNILDLAGLGIEGRSSAKELAKRLAQQHR